MGSTVQPGVAVVTGAGRGIGLAIARRLVQSGHRVLVTDLDPEAVESAVASLGDRGEGAVQDVRDPQSHRRVAAQARRMGRPRVWVNNAGVMITGDCWTHTDDEVAALLAVNVGGVMAGCRAAVDLMRDDGGSILNLASLSALTPVPGLAVYAASKAAVLSFSTSLQGDLRHAGLSIRVHALCPDVARTDMVTAREHDPGAALLFSGPRPISAEKVADEAVRLLGGSRLVRAFPRWRSVLARSSDVAPGAALPVLAAMRRLGDRRQRRATF